MHPGLGQFGLLLQGSLGKQVYNVATFELSQRRHSMNTFISDLFLNPGFDSENDSDLQSDLEFDYFLTLNVILICKMILTLIIF